MSLQSQRAALLASFMTAAAAATLAENCQGVLQMLQGRSDIELAERCRSSFAPEVCRELGSSLGAQPWSSQRIGESCSRFAAASVETSERGLEAAVQTKTPTKQAAAPAPQEEDAKQASLRTRMTPLEVHDVAAPDPKGKTSLARKEAQKSQKAPLRQATSLEKHGFAEPEPETQKSQKAPVRQATPLEKHGLAELEPETQKSQNAPLRQVTPLEKNGPAEPEPEKVRTARLALRRAVQRAEHSLAQSSIAFGLFGRFGPLPGAESVSFTPTLGFGLFAAAAAFVSLSVLRTRRRLARATSARILQGVEQESMSPASSTVE